MDNAKLYLEKMRAGQLCLSACISLSDSGVIEALSYLLDMLWIDTEHSALSLETVQHHIAASRKSGAAVLVRVPAIDSPNVKPLLDMGADGIIFPMVNTGEEARRAVASCFYPPEGTRGYGPRRASRYGLDEDLQFTRRSNESILTFLQIEHIDAISRLDEILATPRLTGIMLGANDLSGSMGLMRQTSHPDVLAAIDTIISKTLAANLFVGGAGGMDADTVLQYAAKGVHWIQIGGDYGLLMKAAQDIVRPVREHWLNQNGRQT